MSVVDPVVVLCFALFCHHNVFKPPFLLASSFCCFGCACWRLVSHTCSSTCLFALLHCFTASPHTRMHLLPPRTAGVAASLVSQPSDTIMVEVNDNDGGEVNILETVRSKIGGTSCGKSGGTIVFCFFLYALLAACVFALSCFFRATHDRAPSQPPPPSPLLLFYLLFCRGRSGGSPLLLISLFFCRGRSGGVTSAIRRSPRVYAGRKPETIILYQVYCCTGRTHLNGPLH